MTKDKQTVGFIGLGIMGLPMAINLVRAGYDVVGYNRSPQKVDKLVNEGGRGATSIAEAVDGADCVITMLPDSPDVSAVVLGEGGVFDHAKSGTLFIDMSTIQPAVAREIETRGAGLGIATLDAPVSGGEQGAIDAALSIMVGGEKAAFDRAGSIFGALGTTIVHVGPAGSGQTVKAANQMIVAGTIALVSEALIFLGANGVDREAAVEVLSGGLAGSRILERKSGSMLARQFNPGFRIELHHKDLGIAMSSAREAGIALPVGALVAQIMAGAKAQGLGDRDHSALLLTLESLSGLPKDN